MGKKSYTGIKNDNPGCIWAFIRVLGYHNDKRVLPYNKKQKPPGRTSKRKVKPKQHQVCPPYEDLEENEIMINSTYHNQVNLDIPGVGLVSKKSLKAKVKALLIIDGDKSKEIDLLHQPQFEVLEHDCKQCTAPTLISLLKANPKPRFAPTHVEELSNHKPNTTTVDSKEDHQASVLEVFKVNHDLFFKVMKNSPPRKPRLVKSRTFPSPNPSESMTPTKVEHKYNEVWHDLKKFDSQRMGGRSSSLKESFDTKREINKGLSRSLKLTNEKEFALFGSHHHASFERSKSYVTNNFDSLVHLEAGLQSNEAQETEQTKTGESPCFEEELMKSHTQMPQDLVYEYNEELQYVNYILDLMGFTSEEDPFGAWHSLEYPLDPALFDGIEVCCPFFEPTLGLSSHHKKILFDLINEALVFVHERSYVVYPKPLSYSCHVRPKRKGKNQVFEEVWEFISEYLKCSLEIDPTLNLVQGSGSGWMNLQPDSEFLALYLEDLIFDSLLDELFC